MKKSLYAATALTTILAQGASSSGIPPRSASASTALTIPFGTPPLESPLEQSMMESVLNQIYKLPALRELAKFPRDRDTVLAAGHAVLERSSSPYTSPARQPSPEDLNRKLSLLLPPPFESPDAEILSLVEAGADSNTMCEPSYHGGSDRFPSVWFATKLATVTLCIERGFDITRTSDRGNSFAHHLIKQWPFSPEKFAIIRYTLELAPILINQTNLSGDSVLTLFAKHVALRCLTQAEQASDDPLIFSTEILTYLLDQGADKNHRCLYAETEATASKIFSDRARAILPDLHLSGFLSHLSDVSRP